MTTRFTPRARDDLRDILDYIAQENPMLQIAFAKRCLIQSA